MQTIIINIFSNCLLKRKYTYLCVAWPNQHTCHYFNMFILKPWFGFYLLFIDNIPTVLPHILPFSSLSYAIQIIAQYVCICHCFFLSSWVQERCLDWSNKPWIKYTTVFLFCSWISLWRGQWPGHSSEIAKICISFVCSISSWNLNLNHTEFKYVTSYEMCVLHKTIIWTVLEQGALSM